MKNPEVPQRLAASLGAVLDAARVIFSTGVDPHRGRAIVSKLSPFFMPNLKHI